jgi:16S rRNA (cytosine1402-N4)-methyltransferase
MALRIAINDELESFREALPAAVSLLRPAGRLVVIAFHSLEDRIAKHGLRALANPCVCPPSLPICACGRKSAVRILTTRPVRPTAAEIADNPRSRSARLRAAEKL